MRQRRRPLLTALGVSVLIHLLFAALVHYLPKLEWARKNRLVNALLQETTPLKNLLEEQKKLTEKEREKETPYPTIFVEVPQEQAQEPPKTTPYYSDKSSVAANPNPEVLQPKEAPKIDGTQEQVIRLAKNAQPKPPQPDPEPPPPEKTPEPQKTEQPKPEPPKPEPQKPEPIQPQIPPTPDSSPKIGDLALAKPSPSPMPIATAKQPPAPAPSSTPPPPPKPKSAKPRTLAQVFDQNPQLRGEKFKQEGGVRKRGVTASLDVRASTFGAYDRAVIQAIEERWFQLLEENAFSGERVGKVVLEFKLKYDGSVTDMKVVETSVGEVLALLCLRAVKDPSLYEKWPSDMRLLYSSGFREVRFTFYYN